MLYMGCFSISQMHIPELLVLLIFSSISENFSCLTYVFLKYQSFIAPNFIKTEMLLVSGTEFGHKLTRVNFFEFHWHYQKSDVIQSFIVQNFIKIEAILISGSSWAKVSRVKIIKFNLHQHKQYYLVIHLANFHQNRRAIGFDQIDWDQIVSAVTKVKIFKFQLCHWNQHCLIVCSANYH